MLQKIIEFIFGKTIIMQNDFFGEMADAGGSYECRRIFKPTGKVVEIGLEKKETTPDEKQVNFFIWLEDNYELVIQKVSPTLKKEIIKFLPKYHIKNFKEEFILEYLYIPKCDTEVFDWRISFYADNDLQHSCALEMKGLEVKSIHIDG